MAARSNLTDRSMHIPKTVRDKITELQAAMDLLVRDSATAHQALSGAGAINLTTRTTLFTSTGAGQALTIADGDVVGQRKRIVHVVDGGSGVITHNGTTIKLANSVTAITLADKGEWVELEWSSAGWVVVGCSPVGILS